MNTKMQYSTFSPLKFTNIIATLLFTCFIWVNGYAQKADTLKVLAIGNSFSRDAVEQYLHELAAAAGKPMIIGNMVIGGAPLSLHSNNANNNKPAYEYVKIDAKGNKTKQKDFSILTALQDEKWNYVSLQQSSPLSGKLESYKEPLKNLHQYIDSIMVDGVKYIWHQTWAYESTSTHKAFPDYNSNQKTMYTAIMNASSKVKKIAKIDLLIPSGTAIQNARTSTLGDVLTRDGYHLNLKIGRFIAACTWFESLFSEQAPVTKYLPSGVSKEEGEIAREAAHKALLKPFAITEISK